MPSQQKAPPSSDSEDAPNEAVSSWQAAASKPRKRWADMTTSSDSGGRHRHRKQLSGL